MEPLSQILYTQNRDTLWESKSTCTHAHHCTHLHIPYTHHTHSCYNTHAYTPPTHLNTHTPHMHMPTTHPHTFQAAQTWGPETFDISSWFSA